MGGDPALPDDDCLHGHLRQGCQTAYGRRGTLRPDGLCRHAPLAVFLDGSVRRLELTGLELQPDLQGLFSTAHRTDRHGGGGLRRLPDQLYHPGRDDGLVSVSTKLADSPASRLRRRRLPRVARAGPVADFPERQIP